jgi:hypothetical protein
MDSMISVPPFRKQFAAISRSEVFPFVLDCENRALNVRQST